MQIIRSDMEVLCSYFGLDLGCFSCGGKNVFSYLKAVFNL